MLVLHANWAGGAVRLWAESTAAGGVAAPSGDRHPFAAEPAAIAAVLGAPGAGLAEGRFALQVPAREGRPRPSDRLADAIPDEGADPEAEEGGVALLERFVVPCLVIEPAEVIGRLAGLEGDPGRLVLAPSVRYWQAVAGFAADLLEDQRFVPTLVRARGSGLEAGWQPWLHDAEARRRAGGLIRAMPPAVRAVEDEHDGAPWPILHDALQAITDATVRTALRAEDFADAIVGRDPADPHVAWLGGLLDGHRGLSEASAPAELIRDAAQWIAGLDEGAVERPVRLVLVLHEPDLPDEEVGPSGFVDARAPWRVSLHLRRAAEREITLDAEELWQDPAAAAAACGGGARPEELVLAELARVARLWPPMEGALEEAAPCGLDLDTAAAHRFLVEYRPLLEEAGFDVRVPEWWGRTGARLAARLLVESEEETPEPGSAGGPASRLLGFDTIVRARWEVAVGDRAIDPETLRRLVAEARGGATLVRLDGRWIELRPEELKGAAELTAEGDEPDGTRPMTLLEAVRAAHGVAGAPGGLEVSGIEARGWVARLLGASSDEKRMPLLPQPETFLGSLRPYQQTGLSWLAFLDAHGFGACLADDMGLGKTIQLIALLLAEREATTEPLGPTLLVAPTSVIGNWTREIERFGPNITMHVQHGADRPLGETFLAKAAEVDVVLTTYALVARDRDVLLRAPWHRVVLDEAQSIKNPPTKQAQTIRALAAPRRVALTGTPVENRLTELWSIMEFLNPGYLGPAGEFRRRFAVPVERHRDPDAADRLRRLVRPFVLRRLKTDPTVIDDLPPCVTTREYASLSPEQAERYEAIVGRMLGAVDDADGIRRRGLVLATLVRLKQVCNHPALLEDASGDGSWPDPAALARRSGKCARMLAMLEEVLATGEKAIVFTQFRRMGHLLSAMIRGVLDAETLFLHGGTPSAKRQEMIDRFQDPKGGVPIFVLSLKAGGVGLNLTAANHVFHFDRWWNPAVEDQATDRAFRIGQTRTVHVHKFVVTGTLEERIDEMLERKTELARNIVGSGEDWLTELSTGRLRELLELRRVSFEDEEEGS